MVPRWALKTTEGELTRHDRLECLNGHKMLFSLHLFSRKNWNTIEYQSRMLYLLSRMIGWDFEIKMSHVVGQSKQWGALDDKFRRMIASRKLELWVPWSKVTSWKNPNVFELPIFGSWSVMTQRHRQIECTDALRLGPPWQNEVEIKEKRVNCLGKSA